MLQAIRTNTRLCKVLDATEQRDGHQQEYGQHFKQPQNQQSRDFHPSQAGAC